MTETPAPPPLPPPAKKSLAGPIVMIGCGCISGLIALVLIGMYLLVNYVQIQ
jgi:hypothetical protein